MADSKSGTIEHIGFVERILDHSVIVRIISESACSACHAKGACTVADMQDKEIEVIGVTESFRIGERVNLLMQQSEGFRALMIGYIYPFIILFAGLLTATAIGLKELIAGLTAIGLLPLYYFCIYLFRNKIRKNFNFSISKLP